MIKRTEKKSWCDLGANRGPPAREVKTLTTTPPKPLHLKPKLMDVIHFYLSQFSRKGLCLALSVHCAIQVMTRLNAA